MIVAYFLSAIIAFVAAIIGALPFGLVNLSVVDLTINKSEEKAFQLGLGASLIEVLFVLAALLVGNTLNLAITTNAWLKYFILFVLVAAGFVFLFRKESQPQFDKRQMNPFAKGIILNLLSVQVFVYWLIAIAFIQAGGYVRFDLATSIIFLISVGAGKMATLLAYRLLALQIRQRAQSFSRSINKTIGSILLLLALAQFVGMLF